MAEVLVQFQEPLASPDKTFYTARVCGRPAPDGGWEGWIEFVPEDGSAPLRSQRETRQSDRDSLLYWAMGLTQVYLEGALARTLEPQRLLRPTLPVEPAYDGPAPSAHAVLDPFSVYVKGENLLRQELNAMSEWHLRNIIRAYGLVDGDASRLQVLGRSELAEQIVAAVRERMTSAVTHA